MQEFAKLIFPRPQLRLKEDAKGCLVWSETRRQWLVLTPEEWVRRHLVAWLISELGVPLLNVVEEYPVPLNGQPQRADVVVIGRDTKPLLLAECKAPEVKIDQSVLDQAARYNAVLGARYLLLTNGLKLFLYELTAAGYRPLDSFPHLY
ncbi:MAG: type I restriction enzyme HsdR N-terminal domain-containing protein [Alistipes sp.]|nr:type I restriction enzyme HsdR N-terminal domain-containing protein [Alistipes sp.]